MKLKKFFAASCMAIFAAAFVSCTNDELEAGGNGSTDNLEERFMSVSITYRGETRADDPTFDNGVAKEHKIKNATLFFFDAAGNPMKVCKNGTQLVSYYDVTEGLSNTPNTNGSNITKSTTIQLIINTKNGEKIPTRVVAVCNYEQMSTLNTLSYSNLKAKLCEIAEGYNPALTDKTTPDGTEYGFTMSNSVYTANDLELFYTPISSANICTTKEESEDNKHLVHIYVERIHAKVEAGTISIPQPEGNPEYTYEGKNYPIYKISDSHEVYVALLGWNVTQIATSTTLGKKIKVDWTDVLNHWNDIPNRRSYWAKNSYTIVLPSEPPYDGTDDSGMRLTHGKFADAHKRPFNAGSDANDPKNVAYIFENAATNDGGTHETNLKFGGSSNKNYDGFSQVIVPGILLKKNGTNFEKADICKWNGSEYTKDKLKETMADQVALELYYYDNFTNSYKSISADDLDFETIQDVTEGLVGSETREDHGIPENAFRRYSAWACLSATAKSKQWYSDEIGSALTPEDITACELSIAEVCTILKSLQPAQVFEEGLTYYYIDIKHLDETKGVVRNHWYRFNLTSIKGYGTPVYDPNKIIIPEKVEDANSFISAHIDILSWRIVANDYILDSK